MNREKQSFLATQRSQEEQKWENYPKPRDKTVMAEID